MDEKKVVVVPRSHVAAARAQVARDKARGKESDPRMVAIANAPTYTGPNSAAVGRAVNGARRARVILASTGAFVPVHAPGD